MGVGVTAVFFLAGLLPWIDNYAHLFGFIFGFLISYAIMPFVTFGIYDRRRKLILLWICLVSAMFIFVGLILLFYVTPSTTVRSASTSTASRSPKTSAPNRTLISERQCDPLPLCLTRGEVLVGSCEEIG